MENSILTNDVCDIVTQMERYIKSDGIKKEKVEKLINEVKYLYSLYKTAPSIVFMADKGIGKTSIINFILDFSYRRQKTKTTNKKKRKIDIYQDVLDTGAGATTSFKVILIQANNNISRIKIEPYSDNETADIIRGFCKKIYHDVFNDKNYRCDVPPEMHRAIVNMINLHEFEVDDNVAKIDLIKQYAYKYEDRFQELVEDLVERCNLENRKTIIFDCDVSDEKASIRSIFRKINLMHLDYAPLPKCVTIEVSKKIFDFKSLGNIHSIIDTRGLEGGGIPTDRKDIRDYFKNQNDKILMLVDKFKSPSNSMIKLLSDYIHEEDYELISRVGYMLNFYDGEPENVLMEDGKAGEEFRGIQYKKEQLVDLLNSNNIKIDENNIIFANPKRFMDSEGAISIDMDDIEDYGSKEGAEQYKLCIRNDDRKELIDSIKSMVDNRKAFILNQIQLKYKEFEVIKNKELDSLNLDKNSIIEKIISLKKNYYSISEKLLINHIMSEYFKSLYPATIMAINNRYGIYFERDIYLVGCNEIEQIYKKPLIKIANYAIKQIYENVETEKEKRIISYAVQAIREYFYKYIDKMNVGFYNYIKDNVFKKEDYEFWNKVMSRWGDGPGYTNDVITWYEMKIDNSDASTYITSMLNNEIDTFKNGLIDVINENL